MRIAAPPTRPPPSPRARAVPCPVSPASPATAPTTPASNKCRGGRMLVPTKLWHSHVNVPRRRRASPCASLRQAAVLAPAFTATTTRPQAECSRYGVHPTNARARPTSSPSGWPPLSMVESHLASWPYHSSPAIRASPCRDIPPVAAIRLPPPTLSG